MSGQPEIAYRSIDTCGVVSGHPTPVFTINVRSCLRDLTLCDIADFTIIISSCRYIVNLFMIFVDEWTSANESPEIKAPVLTSIHTV